MGRGPQVSIDVKIKQAEAALAKAKTKYDIEASKLKDLLEKKQALKKEELLAAVVTSKRSFEDILDYINSDPDTN